MAPSRFTRLLKWIGRLRDPRSLNLDEWVEHHRSRTEADVRRVLPHVPDGGCFVDIGANVGLFSECLLAERPGCEAWLFEPVERFYEACRARFAENPRVRVRHTGLGEAARTAIIYKPRHNFGGNTIVPELAFDRGPYAQWKEDTPFDEEEIRLATFTQLAREIEIGEVDLVKIDAEGYDYAVLEGMLDWLRERRRKPVIIAELLAEYFHPRWERQAAVVEELVALGYREVDLSDMAMIDDVLFIPRDAPA